MDFLDGPVTSVAFCWRVERRDGVTIGLTDHDRDLTIDGLRYRASPGITPSAIKRATGLDADTMDVAGSLSSAAISETDLIAGRWDGARIRLFAIDWTAPGEQVDLGGGVIGAVDTTAHGFSAELRGPGALLDAPVSEETSPECRADLGDKRCRVAMAGRRQIVRIVSATDNVLAVDQVEPTANAYGLGLVRWLTGANTGLSSSVLQSEGDVVTLRIAPVFAVEPGALIELTDGCDKSIATCAGRFANAANFRGEPYLPGIDLLTRYPGA